MIMAQYAARLNAQLASTDVGRDADTYVVGVDQDGNVIEGNADDYLAIVSPPSEGATWSECVGACLDNAPELPAATDDDYSAWLEGGHAPCML